MHFDELCGVEYLEMMDQIEARADYFFIFLKKEGSDLAKKANFALIIT